MSSKILLGSVALFGALAQAAYENVTSSSSIESSSSSSSSVYATGAIVDGNPTFYIHVPASYQPWGSVEAKGSNSDSFSFNTATNKNSTLQLTDTTFDIVSSGFVSGEDSDYTLTGSAIAAAPYYINGNVIINQQAAKLIKREALTFPISYTITENGVYSTSTSTSTSTPGTSTHTPGTTSTGAPSSTVISSTSYSGTGYTVVPVTTGVTVVTATISGVVTSYTTYCPLTDLSSSTTTVGKNGTAILTVTSCSAHNCTQVPITTGLTVITSTSNGVVTSYTTYCPLTSTPGNPGVSTVTTGTPGKPGTTVSTSGVVESTTPGKPGSTVTTGTPGKPGTTVSTSGVVESTTPGKPGSTVTTGTPGKTGTTVTTGVITQTTKSTSVPQAGTSSYTVSEYNNGANSLAGVSGAVVAAALGFMLF